MRRSAGPIGCALTAIACLAGPPSPAAEPTPDEANTPLTAVTKRPSYAFASTPAGLFRAPLKTKRWERLTMPPGMPPNGTFAREPEDSPLVFYVALRPRPDGRPREGDRYGLYLSRDDGATWELVAERPDIGATLLLADGTLFAVTGADGANAGRHLLRSADLGKTWRDVTGNAHGQFQALSPDPDRPGKVRIDAWALRSYDLVAEGEGDRWKVVREHDRRKGRLPSDEFFSRDSSSTNRFYLYPATLSNYFRHDFGDQTQVQALEVVPLGTRFEFARGARVEIPIRVVFHHDPDATLALWREAEARGQHFPKPTIPAEKIADQPDGTDFWGVRVETPGGQVEKYPSGRNVITTTVTATPDGKTTSSTYQPPRVPYKVFDLSPSRPYERRIDLGRLFNFAKPGTYRVQLIYSSGGHPDDNKDVWDGNLTSPVFTVVIRE